MHPSLVAEADDLEDLLTLGLENLEAQFKQHSGLFAGLPIRAMYFGGGSPSLMPPSYLERLFTLIDKYWIVEHTADNMLALEGHPSQITEEWITIARDWGINRFSMGVQSLDPKVLQANNRIVYSKEQILDMYDMLSSYFSRVNLDLMFGIRRQTLRSHLKDVKALLDHDVQRLTIYGFNNSREARPIQNEEQYQKLAIEAIELTKHLAGPQYNFIGSEKDDYREFNCYFKSGLSFKYPYGTEPLYPFFNNILGFSMSLAGAANWFVPLGMQVLISPVNNQIIIRQPPTEDLEEMDQVRQKYLDNDRPIKTVPLYF